MTRTSRSRLISWPLLVFLAALSPWPPFPCLAAPALSAELASPLVQGKERLESKDYDKAIALLTESRERVPLLADYALLWRSRAYEAKGEIPLALSDLEALARDHPDSPLQKKARRREIELRAQAGDARILPLVEQFLRDYPSEAEMKLLHAQHLRKCGRDREAKTVLKDLFVQATPLSARVLAELSPSDITAGDLLKKGRNLNSAWQFEEAEKTFREALRKEGGVLRGEIQEGLGYALFRQKRYRESADIYRKVASHYWLARSLLRAGEIAQFESLLPALVKSQDKRLGQVIVDYGTRKRREGDLEAALVIYDGVLASHPSSREDGLWAKAWAYYLARDYGKALELLTQLADEFGDSRYRYWKGRAAEALKGRAEGAVASAAGPEHRDFYGYLSALRAHTTVRGLRKTSARLLSAPPPSERVRLLTSIGLAREAAAEITHLSKKNGAPDSLLSLSISAQKLDDFKTSVTLASKLPYDEELHGLLYPRAFWPEVEKAATETGVDPFLILAVIREESRYAADATSIAGALGLMQLMPATARRLSAHAHLKIDVPQDLFNHRVNILLGSQYLKNLLASFRSLPLALAAYNAGEHNVRDWVKKGSYRSADEFIEDIPFGETRTYVKKVLSSYFEYLRTVNDLDLSTARRQMGTL